MAFFRASLLRILLHLSMGIPFLLMEEDTTISSNNLIPFLEGWEMRSPFHRKRMNDDQWSMVILLMKEKWSYKKRGNRKIHESLGISEGVISETNTMRGDSELLHIVLLCHACVGVFYFRYCNLVLLYRMYQSVGHSVCTYTNQTVVKLCFNITIMA